MSQTDWGPPYFLVPVESGEFAPVPVAFPVVVLVPVVPVPLFAPVPVVELVPVDDVPEVPDCALLLFVPLDVPP